MASANQAVAVGIAFGIALSMAIVLTVVYVSDVIINSIGNVAYVSTQTTTTITNSCQSSTASIPIIGGAVGSLICPIAGGTFSNLVSTPVQVTTDFLVKMVETITAAMLQGALYISLVLFLVFFFLGYIGTLIVGRKTQLGAFALAFLGSYVLFFMLLSAPGFSGGVARALIRMFGGP